MAWTIPKIQYGVLRSAAQALARLDRTTGGHPRLRPAESRRLVEQINEVVKQNLGLIRAGDRQTLNALSDVISSSLNSDLRFYPRELLALRILEVQIHIAANDAASARRSVGFWLDRPYAAEAGLNELAALYAIDGTVRLIEGQPAEEIGGQTLWRVITLAALRPWLAFPLYWRFIPLLALHTRRAIPRGLPGVVVRAARASLLLDRPWSRFRRIGLNSAARLIATVGCLALFLHVSLPRRLTGGGTTAGANRGDRVIVSRAMGGIGDLIMMTPGLQALAKRYNRPVKFITSRKFSAIFENNPAIELIEMEGDPVDLAASAVWRNLTICPAAAYESRVAPFVKRGRVRLFARGMGIGWGTLLRTGAKPHIPLARKDRDFAASFLDRHGFAQQIVIGVQPYSRDSYKDHPDIGAMIARLSEEFNILIFHHVAEGLPTGPRIATTAGLPLSQSLALAERVDALVTVDSAFLHASSAFDVPVVALFGPTDGYVVADHHKKKVVVTAAEVFPCRPCWRNEDLPCKVTGQTGMSPCMASIPYSRVRSALDEALAMRSRPG